MQIIDSHAHEFPLLSESAAFALVEDHLATLQWAVRQHVQPVMRTSDNSRVTRQTLLREPSADRSSLTDVGIAYEEHGPAKVVWGSDLPNVERSCTYRQRHEQLDNNEFLSADDRRLIRGGNIARLVGPGDAG